jgi:hypothetical protein
MFIKANLRNSYLILIWLMLILSLFALSIELVPEIEAKMIVVPTLAVIAALCIAMLSKKHGLNREVWH